MIVFIENGNERYTMRKITRKNGHRRKTVYVVWDTWVNRQVGPDYDYSRTAINRAHSMNQQYGVAS